MMTTAPRYEMTEVGTSGVWQVRNLLTGTETIGLSKAAARRVKALVGR
jgi:hypothetical protein